MLHNSMFNNNNSNDNNNITNFSPLESEKMENKNNNFQSLESSNNNLNSKNSNNNFIAISPSSYPDSSKFTNNSIISSNIKNISEKKQLIIPSYLKNDFNEKNFNNIQLLKNDDDEIIEGINNGQIFNKIQLRYKFPENDFDFENNVKELKTIYNQNLDSLDKAMDNYKSYIENYYRQKIQKINQSGGVELTGLEDGELPIMKITSQHSESLNKLRELYEVKVKELENGFFNTLRTLTNQRMGNMNSQK